VAQLFGDLERRAAAHRRRRRVAAVLQQRFHDRCALKTLAEFSQVIPVPIAKSQTRKKHAKGWSI
jgi:hypothetical protein